MAHLDPNLFILVIYTLSGLADLNVMIYQSSNGVGYDKWHLITSEDFEDFSEEPDRFTMFFSMILFPQYLKVGQFIVSFISIYLYDELHIFRNVFYIFVDYSHRYFDELYLDELGSHYLNTFDTPDDRYKSWPSGRSNC